VKPCKDMRDAMVAVVFGDADDETRAAFEAHVAGCADCTRALAEMRETLSVTRRRERPDPGAAFWAAFADRVESRIARDGAADTSDTAWWRRRVGGARATWTLRAAAAAAILVIGVIAGRTILAPRPAPVDAPQLSQMPARDSVEATPGGVEPEDVARGETTPPAVEPAPAAIDGPPSMPRTELASSSDRALCYVEKSQLLLLALVNSEPDPDGTAADLATQRARSGALLAEAPSIRAELDDPRQRRLRKLVGDLEMILREIANLESENDVEAVEFIRGRIDRHDVLLKIDLEQLRYGDEGEACGAEQPQSGGTGNGTGDSQRSI